MSNKPDVTLQPSKGIITEAAARVYAAHIATGSVKDDKDINRWIRRSIREAVAIARAVDKSVLSDDELPADQPLIHQPQQFDLDSTDHTSDVEEAVQEVLLDSASQSPSKKTNHKQERIKSKTGRKVAHRTKSK